MDKNESYIYGLLLADGSLNLQERNRGKISLEIQESDKDLVFKLFQLIPGSTIRERVRNTNFKEEYHSIIFSNSKRDFREKLIKQGFPTKNKTDNAVPPVLKYFEKDFWRGVLDGDGSLGFTSDNKPFVSLVTKSEKLKNAYLDFLFKNYNIIKNISRNKRDNVYNIVVLGEDAVKLSKELWIDSELYLNRKYKKAKELQLWERPKSLRKKPKYTKRSWNVEEDNYILTHTLEDSEKNLYRSKSAIQTRLWRLKQKHE